MYPWFVVLHLLGLLLFVAAHGVTMWVSFRVRRERERSTIAMLLGASAASLRLANLGLIVLVVGGLGAAATGGFLTATWNVASYVVLIAVVLVMGFLGSSLYYPLRDELAPKEGVPAIDDAELARRLENRRPETLATVGGLGLVILTWLMVVKPGG